MNKDKRGVNLSVRLTKEEDKKLAERAQLLDRTKSYLARWAIRQFIFCENLPNPGGRD